MDVKGYLSDQTETRPLVGVIVHGGPHGSVATVHSIDDAPDGGAPYLSPGEPMTHENLADLVARLAGGHGGRRQVLPECVLVADPGLLVWWRPAQHRHVFFDTDDKDFDAKATGRVALHPALLFVGMPRLLFAFALDADARPDMGTALFRAPYYNLYASGRMCEGNVPMPEQPLPTAETVEAYERAFFDSSFAHTNLGERDLTTHPGGHNGLWRSLVAADHRHFPAWALIRAEHTGNPLTLGLLLERALVRK